MKIIPMGDYYVWHCEWCDSTNYTIWTRMERDGLTCNACHHKFSAESETSPAFNRLKIPENCCVNLNL